MRRVTITRGWFRTAGTKYGWETAHDVRGVGINLEILQSHNEIEIEVEGDLYRLYTSTALNFARDFKSGEFHDGVKVLVVSKSLLRAKYKPPPKLRKKSTGKDKVDFSPTDVLQKPLF